VLRLGSAVLTAVLLGVPRALDTRAFGADRSVYFQVADPSPGLAGFADALSRALERAGGRAVKSPAGATTVVEVHGLWRLGARGPGPSRAISLTVQDARGRRPLVLHYAAGREAEAARALLDVLDGPEKALRAPA